MAGYIVLSVLLAFAVASSQGKVTYNDFRVVTPEETSKIDLNGLKAKGDTVAGKVILKMDITTDAGVTILPLGVTNAVPTELCAILADKSMESATRPFVENLAKAAKVTKCPIPKGTYDFNGTVFDPKLVETGEYTVSIVANVAVDFIVNIVKS